MVLRIMKDSDHNWLLRVWATVFLVLSRLSFLHLIRVLGRRDLYGPGFVERYVLTHTVLALAALAALTCLDVNLDDIPAKVLALYGALRIFETAVYQLNVLLFDQYRQETTGGPGSYQVHGHRRTVLLLMHNYFELIGWFGVLHVLMLHRGDLTFPTEVDQAGFFRVFRENLLLTVSFHAEAVTARTQLGQALLAFQNLVGVLMTFLVLARVIAMLPPPKSLDRHDP